jgi:hypothetical protein
VANIEDTFAAVQLEMDQNSEYRFELTDASNTSCKGPHVLLPAHCAGSMGSTLCIDIITLAKQQVHDLIVVSI